MSLTQRLRKIEADIEALQAATASTAEALADLLAAIETDDPEPEQEPARDLDGNPLPAERDETAPL